MKKVSFLLLAVLMVACTKSPEIKHLTILHTNDTHSQVLPEKRDTIGGYARRIGLINKERETEPNLLLLDAGDFSQGTPYYNYYHGKVEIEAMNWMKYDAATLGNHEFDYGLDTLAKYLKMADFPIVCANYGVTGTPLEGIVKPFEIFERNGIKVGVFGLGCDPRSVIDDENFAPIKYLGPEYTVAQQMADTLRSLGCDVVVCLSHQGTKPHNEDPSEPEPYDVEMVTQTRGIDIVIGGHTHETIDTLVNNMDGQPVRLCQMGKYGGKIGKIMLSVRDKNEK